MPSHLYPISPLIDYLRNPVYFPHFTVNSHHWSILHMAMCYAKGFDQVDHQTVGKILKEMADHITCLLRDLYAAQGTIVSLNMEWTGSKLGKRAPQGCISPCLFNLYTVYIM